MILQLIQVQNTRAKLSLSWQRHSSQPALVMGVLNCTPDSFSDGLFFDDSCIEEGLTDGGTFHKSDKYLHVLVRRAKMMMQQGADIIDVGGESTRPDATPVSLDEELRRVMPVIRSLIANKIPVSVDTMKADIMEQAIAEGASLINDVSALRFDPRSIEVVASAKVSVCLMHMLGSPATMQRNPNYIDVVDEVITFFEQRIEACLIAGIEKSALILDPGIGFGKRLQDNLTLIANLQLIKNHFKMPILLGASRKSFLGEMTGASVNNRELETAVVSGLGIFNGADMIRVHDCAQHKKTALVASYLADSQGAAC